MVIREYSKVELVFSSSESEAVKIALVNLRRDLIRTLMKRFRCHKEKTRLESERYKEIYIRHF